MKLLVDSCLSAVVAAQLRAAGHDVVWAGDWDHDPGDVTVLARAHEERRAVVTLDKDFGELAVLHGLPHSGIIRLVELSKDRQAFACDRACVAYADGLLEGAIVIIEADRVRYRPPPEV